MVDTRSDHGLPLESLNERYQAAERQLRVLEGEKSDFFRAVRSLLKAVAHGMPGLEGQPQVSAALDRLSADLAGGQLKPEDLEKAAVLLAQGAGGRVGTYRENADIGREEVLAPQNREAFLEFIRQISDFRGDRYQSDATSLAKIIGLGTLESFHSRLASFLLRFVQDCRAERVQISSRLSGIIKTLLTTEREFRIFLDQSINYMGNENKNFANNLTDQLDKLQESVSEAAQEPERLLTMVADKIETLCQTIHRKTLADDNRLKALSSEKEALECRLDTVRRDYDSFVRQSHKLLKELEDFRSISLKDPLTGVYNRRAYDEEVVLTFNGYTESKLSTFSLIIFDIDNFREVNNTYGHLAGDSILTHIARIVAELLRCDDFVFRYGGDEFIVLLPQAKLEDAVRIAEKLRTRVAAVEFMLSRTSDKFIHLTISLGVSEARPDDNPTTLLARADKALYESKQNGRNRVTSFD
jgi:diguanylate cyclase